MGRKLRWIALIAAFLAAIIAIFLLPIPSDDQVPLAYLRGAKHALTITTTDAYDKYRIDEPYTVALQRAKQELQAQGWMLRPNPQSMSSAGWFIRPLRFAETMEMRVLVTQPLEMIPYKGKRVLGPNEKAAEIDVYLARRHRNLLEVVTSWYHHEFG